ncbi:uncharacterized protein C8Q71DRAFT_132075 [Rhodofomes roseus]|uniref:Tail specific protease domain-containing protein n=1 Tax=Rhodofomes roseus TaxID=34475 RepID=A0ABQ8KBI8_9APHY|nr:uncharacterized protein C8Q71DRAFT_132075 [Rhodofomes roseus]KAH9834923.1 hypothetical protein C8Q71DRAFT_132075 [Rhodofomes roseus]
MRSITTDLALLAAASALLKDATASLYEARAEDPCAKIAGQSYVAPADARACLSYFPFNETLRQNVLDVVSKVFDFYTFEDYYLAPIAEFGQPAVNIRDELARINSTGYASDYAFNKDLFDVVNGLNDGHTGWYTYCYWETFQNLLPAPVISLEVDGAQDVYVVPDLVEFISLLGTEYTSYYASLGFDWARLAGARVVSIEGLPAYSYVDYIADTVSGNYLDHGVRVNSVFSSYRISGGNYSQRFGDLAGPVFPDLDNLTMEVILGNGTEPETVVIPYLAGYLGEPFTDAASYWANNCAANNETNGVDYLTQGAAAARSRATLQPRGALAASNSQGFGIPSQFVPNLTAIYGEDILWSYILPDNKTGVMFVGSFEPEDYYGFQSQVASVISTFLEAGVTQLLIDLSNNGGGYVCLGEFLHTYLAGADFGFPGYSSAVRANTLAQKIVAADIAQGINDSYAFYPPDNWAYEGNDTAMDQSYNYITPYVTRTINGVAYNESQRFYDVCTPFNVTIPAAPPFDLSKVAIVGNGDCASTCAQFSTLMYERHNTTIAIFGGKPGETMQFKGMAGEQVLEWYDIDSEIKTAGLQDDPLAPPDLLVNADFRHNWRTAYSWEDEEIPIAYYSDLPQLRFPYTPDTYMSPQALWIFAAEQIFGSSTQ